MKLSHDAHEHEHDVHALLDDEPLPPPDHPASIAMARLLSDTLALWCLCRSARCRRNRTCKGDPHECLADCAPLLSDEVYDGGAAFLQGQSEGLSFDQALACWPEPLAELSQWIGRVEHNPARRR